MAAIIKHCWLASYARRRRLQLVGLPCTAMLALYLVLGSPTMRPANSSRTRSLVELDPVASAASNRCAGPTRTGVQAGRLEANCSGAGSIETAEIATCMADSRPHVAFGVDDFVHARPARLTLVAAHHSWLPQPRNSITMMLTTTADRLHRLEDLCQSWPFPVTLAVYVPIFSSNGSSATAVDTAVESAAAAVHEAFDRSEELESCQLFVALYSEHITEQAQPLFPINSLRNQALLMASTDLVLVSNIDMLIGSSFVKALSNSVEFDAISSSAEANNAIIVPAFETPHATIAQQAAAGGKEAVAQLWRPDGSGHLQYFRQKHFPQAHNATDYLRWIGATSPYVISTHEADGMWFEPWYVMSRRHLGAFDVRFRGYGRNKAQQVRAQLHVHKTRFIVHPRAFMIHRPHANSAARARYDSHVIRHVNTAEQFNVFKLTDGWYWWQVGKGKRFMPLVSAAYQRCRSQLSWWQDVPEAMHTTDAAEEVGDSSLPAAE